MQSRNSHETRQRRRLAPLTPLRAYRLERGITLAEVAARSGMTTFRVSIIERDPSVARPDEIEAHRITIDKIHGEISATMEASDATV